MRRSPEKCLRTWRWRGSVKQAGIRLHFASGARHHARKDVPDVWRDVAGLDEKSVSLMGGTPRAVGRELFRVVPWIPLLLLPLVAGASNLWSAGIAVAGGAPRRLCCDLRRNRFPAVLALYYLSAVALYAAALLTSESRYAKGSVKWKGREYPVDVNRD